MAFVAWIALWEVHRIFRFVLENTLSFFFKKVDCVSLPGDCGFSHVVSSRSLNEVANDTMLISNPGLIGNFCLFLIY